jgi:hypothetical protein
MKYLVTYQTYNENVENDTEVPTTFIVSGKSMDQNLAKKRSESNLKKLESMFKKDFKQDDYKMKKDGDSYVSMIEASAKISPKKIEAFNKAMSKYENVPFKIKQ